MIVITKVQARKEFEQHIMSIMFSDIDTVIDCTMSFDDWLRVNNITITEG